MTSPDVRKSVERVEALTQRGGLFAEAVRMTRIPMVVSDPNLPGDPIVFVNDAFLAMSGYGRDEVLGRSPHFLTSPGPHENSTRTVDRSLAGGGSETVELALRRKDGSIFTASLSARPIEDENGHIEYHFFSYLDTTERLDHQRSRREAEQRFRLLVEGVTDYAIYMLDPAGYVTSWNSGAERIKGYSAEEIIGNHVSHFYTEEDADAGAVQTALETAMRDGRFETESWRVRKDGTKFWAHVVISALRDPSGHLIGFAKVTRDTTESRRAREAQIANEAKTEFLATMSHEIRTPLNGVIGYTERLLDEELTPNQRLFAKRIQNAGSMLLTVVEDILDFSRIEAGRIELEYYPFSLEALVDNAISIVSLAAEEKRLSVRFELDPEIPKILTGDEARIRQVILNLLSNAVKFTFRGHITLKVRSEGRTEQGEILRFNVTDTGIGIPHDKSDQLFRRFSQLDASIRRDFGGTGLGLAISKRLIELMDGEIGYEAEEGGGSTFWFRLVLPVADLLHTAMDENGDSEPPRRARILVAEDLEINQELARSILERAGHEVDVVADGAAAVQAVASGRYDLVLMDVQMPVLDGLGAVKAIRALAPPLRDIPVISMTANVLPEQIRRSKRAGVNDQIGKPIRRADLLKKVHDWLPAATVPPPGGSEPTLSTDPVSDQAIFDQATFDHLLELVGSGRIVDWIRRLEEQIEAAFTNTRVTSRDRERLGRMAHDMVSHAGSLGFVQFADCCSKLQEAVLGGGDLSRSFEDANSAAERARPVLERLLAKFSR